jgi:hypothetical protein
MEGALPHPEAELGLRRLQEVVLAAQPLPVVEWVALLRQEAEEAVHPRLVAVYQVHLPRHLMVVVKPSLGQAHLPLLQMAVARPPLRRTHPPLLLMAVVQLLPG